MQFQRKTTPGSFTNIGKLIIKIVIFLVLLFVAVILIEKIDFPKPNKKIQKVIPNENFKIIK